MNLTDVPQAKYSTLIPLINRLSLFQLFTVDNTKLLVSELPFMKNYQLLSAQSFSTSPLATIFYLWCVANDDIIKLNGTRQALFDNLDKIRLVLNRDTVVPYIAFVLDYAPGLKGMLRLVQRADEIECTDAITEQQKAFLDKTVVPAKVVKEEEGFYISCIIINVDTLFETQIRLEENGLFDFIGERQLGEPIPALKQTFLEQ